MENSGVVKEAFKVLKRIWGNREGYVFLPWIAGDSSTQEQRRRNYHEGRAFLWPSEAKQVLKHMHSHTNDDLYFCPNLFDMKLRQTQFAREERALWADLDEVHPEAIESSLRPTIAWESSPGSYQAVWLLTEDALLASEAGGLGQRLTYHLNADLGGWDATQLLRPPGWRNHKLEYREEYGREGAPGKLLWGVGPRYRPHDIDEQIPELTVTYETEDVLEQEIEQIDRHKVMARITNQLNSEVKRLMRSRSATGDRSKKLFYIEQSLAEAGCTRDEIIALVRPTVWNKFKGRDDELKRLKIEAAKAIKQARDKPETDFQIAEGLPEKPENILAQVKHIPPTNWLIEDMWIEGACGFIAGMPKTSKSFVALDFAISLATGLPFLGHFEVNDPGPVLYLSEEDHLALFGGRVRQVLGKKLKGKAKLIRTMDSDKYPWYPLNYDLPVDIFHQTGAVFSQPAHREWLDEQLSRRDYRAVIMDTFSYVAGSIKANDAQEITPHFLKPLNLLSEKHGCAVILIHHLVENEKRKLGQRLMGSTAIHAWLHCGLFLLGGPEHPKVTMVRISKESSQEKWAVFRRFIGGKDGLWAPEVWMDEDVSLPDPLNKTHKILHQMGKGSHLLPTIVEAVGLGKGTVQNHLTDLRKAGIVTNPNQGEWRYQSTL